MPNMEPTSSEAASLVENLSSPQGSVRQLTSFQLNSRLNGPGLTDAFIDSFIRADGIPVLQRLSQQENGKTLSYVLGSLAAIVEQGHPEALSSDVAAKVQGGPLSQN